MTLWFIGVVLVTYGSNQDAGTIISLLEGGSPTVEAPPEIAAPRD